MTRIENLEKTVRKLYESRNPKRDEWADWLYENHIFVVKDWAKTLAGRFDANAELSQAAAVLHDIADTRMPRYSENHKEKTQKIAQQLLEANRFTSDETKNIVDDAIKFHSCKEGNVPKTEEGRILATADALAHLMSDFYLYACWSMGKRQSFEETKKWALAKIDRDFEDKILFLDLKKEVEPRYKFLKDIFSGKSSIVFTKKIMDEAKLFTDGGSRGNPGESAGAYVICNMDDDVVEKTGFYIGITTNNQAEYKALKAGLEQAAKLGVQELNVFMDSELVVKQVNGSYKVKHKDIAPLFAEVKVLMSQFKKISVSYVPRALNKLADEEVNRILDEKASAKP